MASMTSMASETLQTFFHFIKTVMKVLQCVLSLKASFIYWKATRVFLDYTHRSAVRANFVRHLPASLWTMVLQTSESVYHLNF